MFHKTAEGCKVSVTSRKEIPSTQSKQQVLRILHAGIDLAIFEEPARIECMWIGIHRFIAEDCPFEPSASCHEKATETSYVPHIAKDCGTSRDELSLVY